MIKNKSDLNKFLNSFLFKKEDRRSKLLNSRDILLLLIIFGLKYNSI